MCISGLGYGDILCWILLLVFVQKSTGHTVEIFLETVDRKQTLKISFLTHCTSLAVTTLFLSLAASFYFLSLLAHLLVDPKLLHKGDFFSPQKK